MQRDAQLIEEHGIVRILLAQHSVLIHCLAICLRAMYKSPFSSSVIWCSQGSLSRWKPETAFASGGTKAFLAGIIAGLANRGEGQANEEKTNGQRQSEYESWRVSFVTGQPYSGFVASSGLGLSESFFLPPKIPKIFFKGFFFFSSSLSLASLASGVGCVGWPCPVAYGGRFGSYGAGLALDPSP